MDVGFENGNITLNHQNGVYYAGGVINGNINFCLDQYVNITEINIQFLGEAKVLWWEEETKNIHGRSMETRVDYGGHEEYFNSVQRLSGGEGVQQLKPGPHTIPFQYQIPHLVPSSFKGKSGEVLYQIRAYMVFPEPTRRREELAKMFEVVAPLDLNKADPEIAERLQVSFEEMYTCGCTCSPKPVNVEVGLPAIGFCPGQAVPVTVDVRNDANIERTRYHSQKPVADFTTPEERLLVGRTSPVLSKTERHFTCDLVLPAMLAPNLAHCHLISVEYFFRVVIQLSGCNEDLEDTTQIFIGLIPLDKLKGDEYVHPMAHSLPPGPIPEFSLPTVTQQNIYPVNAAYPTPPGYPNNATSPYPTPSYPNANPSYPAPNYEIGFKVDPPAPCQPVASGYPMQTFGANVSPAGYPQNASPYNRGPVPSYNPTSPSAPNF